MCVQVHVKVIVQMPDEEIELPSLPHPLTYSLLSLTLELTVLFVLFCSVLLCLFLDSLMVSKSQRSFWLCFSAQYWDNRHM